MSDPIIMEGVIAKLGGFFWTSPQDRFFILKGHLMSYWATKEESKTAASPRGALDIRACDIIRHDDPRRYPADAPPRENAERRWTMRSPLLKREYVLEAKSNEDREKWIEKIVNVNFTSSTSSATQESAKYQEFITDTAKHQKVKEVAATLTKIVEEMTAAVGGKNNTETAADSMNSGVNPTVCVEKTEQLCGGPGVFSSVDKKGFTVLHTVVSEPWCSSEFVKAMMNKGAMLHARTFSGDTILHIAIASGRGDFDPMFIQFLLDYGINVLACGADDFTALHLLCIQQRSQHFPQVLKMIVGASNEAAQTRATFNNTQKEKYSIINAVAGKVPVTPLYLLCHNKTMEEEDIKMYVNDFGGDVTWTRDKHNNNNNNSNTAAAASSSSSSIKTKPTILQPSIMSDRATSRFVLEKCLEKGLLPDQVWFEHLIAKKETTSTAVQFLTLVENAVRANRGKVFGDDDAASQEKLGKIAACVDYETLTHALTGISITKEKGNSLALFDKLVSLGANVKDCRPSSYEQDRKNYLQEISSSSSTSKNKSTQQPQEFFPQNLLFEAVKSGRLATSIEKCLELGLDVKQGASLDKNLIEKANLRISSFFKKNNNKKEKEEKEKESSSASAATSNDNKKSDDNDDNKNNNNNNENENTDENDENEEILLEYPIDRSWWSAMSTSSYEGRKAGVADPWQICNRLLDAGSPATALTLDLAIQHKTHDSEVFEKLVKRVLETKNVSTIQEAAPDAMLTLVVNGGVEGTSKKHGNDNLSGGIGTIVDAAEILCQYGADCDAIDDNGDSVLHGIAIRIARLKSANVAVLFRILLTKGKANWKIRNKKNETPIQVVCDRKSSMWQYQATWKVILEHLSAKDLTLACAPPDPSEVLRITSSAKEHAEQLAQKKAMMMAPPPLADKKNSSTASQKIAASATTSSSEKKNESSSSTTSSAETKNETVTMIKLEIKSLTGRTTEVEIEPSQTVDDLVVLVAEKTSTPENQVSLLFSGNRLVSGNLLSEYKIENKSTITLVTRRNSTITKVVVEEKQQEEKKEEETSEEKKEEEKQEEKKQEEKKEEAFEEKKEEAFEEKKEEASEEKKEEVSEEKNEQQQQQQQQQQEEEEKKEEEETPQKEQEEEAESESKSQQQQQQQQLDPSSLQMESSRAAASTEASPVNSPNVSNNNNNANSSSNTQPSSVFESPAREENNNNNNNEQQDSPMSPITEDID